MSIVVPGRETLAKQAPASLRLITHAIEQDCVVDIARARHLLHPESTELAMTILGECGEPTAP